MIQNKLRIIRPEQLNRGYKPIYGISIPDSIALFFKDTHFTIHKTPDGILLLSGTSFKQIKDNFDLEQFKV